MIGHSIVSENLRFLHTDICVYAYAHTHTHMHLQIPRQKHMHTHAMVVQVSFKAGADSAIRW